MKKVLLGISLILCIVVVFLVYKTLQIPENPVHYHANFAVFLNNTQTNFADANYMHLKPCKEDGSDISDNKLDNVHLHDMVGNVVHVHQAGITWNDLFKSVQYNLESEIAKAATVSADFKVKYYLNNELKDASILASQIEKNQRLLISGDIQPPVQNSKENEITQKQYEAVGSNASEYDNPGTSGESCSGSKKRSLTTRFKLALKDIFK